jgi:hypothetical protein
MGNIRVFIETSMMLISNVFSIVEFRAAKVLIGREFTNDAKAYTVNITYRYLYSLIYSPFEFIYYSYQLIINRQYFNLFN